MTKKHFNALAKMVQDLPAQFDRVNTRSKYNDEFLTYREIVTDQLVETIEELNVNPRFDSHRFIKACLEKK